MVAQQLLDVLAEPFTIAGQELYVRASIGIAHGRAAAASDQLLRDADLAMYAAKHSGKNGYRTFEAGTQFDALDKLELGSALRRALDRDEIFVQYQPIIDLVTGHVVGAEALARWNHPERGPIGPDTFIPLAEENGLIVELGRSRAADRLQAGPGVATRTSPAHSPFDQCQRLARAAHPARFRRPSRVRARRSRGSPRRRSSSRSRRRRSCATPTGAFSRSARSAPSECGSPSTTSAPATRRSAISISSPSTSSRSTGASSPRSTRATADRSLAPAIVSLAAALDLVVVAEGVETELQGDTLRGVGCELAQGYYFARPLDPVVMGQLLVVPAPATPDLTLSH